MRTLIIDRDEIRAQTLSSWFGDYNCTVEIADPEDPADIKHLISPIAPTIIAISPEYTDIFNAVSSHLPGWTTHLNTENYNQFDIKAIFAEVAARHNHQPSHILQVGDLKLDMALSNFFMFKDDYFPLTSKEYMVLRLLMLRNGTIISNEEMTQALYDDINKEPQDYGSLRHSMRKLRIKLANAKNTQSEIQAIRFFGYTLSTKNEAPKIAFSKGPVTIFADNTASYFGAPLELEPAQLRILQFLLEKSPGLASYDKLTSYIFATSNKDEPPKPATLGAHLFRLRKQIARAAGEDIAYGHRVIETRRGEGLLWHTIPPKSQLKPKPEPTLDTPEP